MEEAVKIPSRLALRLYKPMVKNGGYSARTGRRTKVGYFKHRHQGCTIAPRYSTQ